MSVIRNSKAWHCWRPAWCLAASFFSGGFFSDSLKSGLQLVGLAPACLPVSFDHGRIARTPLHQKFGSFCRVLCLHAPILLRLHPLIRRCSQLVRASRAPYKCKYDKLVLVEPQLHQFLVFLVASAHFFRSATIFLLLDPPDGTQQNRFGGQK